MVHGVAGGAVDDGAVGHVLPVVDHDGPDLDEGEEGDVGEFLQREDEGEEVVGHALGEAVERVEGVRGEWRRHDPFVVWFVESSVEDWVVQAAVDPVDEAVREEEEEGELENVPRSAEDGQERMVDVGQLVVDEAVAADFGNEARKGEDGHYGYRCEGLLDLHFDLVPQVFRVVESRLVEDGVVAECGAKEVDDCAEQSAVGISETFYNTAMVTATHVVTKYKLAHCRYTLSRSHLLIYAYSLGCTLKKSLAGWNCQLDLVNAPSAALAAAFQPALCAPYPFKLAVMVEIGSKVDTDGCMGNKLA